MTGIGNPSSRDKESEIKYWNPESKAWNPESRIQDLLDFLTLDEKKEHEFPASLTCLLKAP